MATGTLAWQAPPVSAPVSLNPFGDLEEKSPSSLPAARTYFTMLADSHLPNTPRLLIFGGFGDHKGRFNDLHAYTPAHGWRLVTTQGEGPKPIYLHSAVIVRNKLVIYGGNVGRDTSEMFELDLDSLHWRYLAPQSPTVPPSRYGHAACVVLINNSPSMVIVGGCKAATTYYQDSWSYDFHSQHWTRLGDVPIDLAYHSLWTYENSVYLHGGFNGKTFNEHLYRLDTSTGSWIPVRINGTLQPPPMCGAAVSVIGRHSYIFGGYTSKGHTNDLYRIDLNTRTWELIHTNNKPVSRAYLQSAAISASYYVFGGYEGKQCVQDFKMLTVKLEPILPTSRPSLGNAPIAQPVHHHQHVHSHSHSGVTANGKDSMSNLFAGLSVQQPPPQAQPVAAPISIHQPIASQTNPNVNGVTLALKESSRPSSIETLMRQYGHGKDYLDRKDLDLLLTHLQSHLQSVTLRPVLSNGPQPPPKPQLAHSHSAAARFPFTQSTFATQPQSLGMLSSLDQHPRLQDIIDIGFTRTHVLSVLQAMQSEGVDIRNFEMIVDRCLREADRSQPVATKGDTVHGGGSGLAALLHSAMTEKDEVRQCTICYERIMNCVFLDCGHFMSCMECGKGMLAANKAAECPVCRARIKQILKIYWT